MFSRLSRCCKKCKKRSFNSRGGLLILIWNICIVAAVFVTDELLAQILESVLNETFTNPRITPTIILRTAFLVVFFVVAPLIGWLADRYGNFFIFKIGSTGLFIGSVLFCSILVYTSALGDSFVNYPVLFAALIILCFLDICCIIAIFTALLKLGLNQLPYSSSESIASFINWLFFCILAGIWLGHSIGSLMRNCIMQKYGTVILALVPVVFMSIVLGSNFFFSNQWLIKDTVSPQSLKNIYQVLKFAATHKTPINRSALTYWEDDIPSRIDLAKQRYGGPYTTEEVEDVKTFLKLLIVFLPLIFTMSVLMSHGLGLNTKNHSLLILNYTECVDEMIYSVTYNPIWCTMMKTVFYEFIIYPLVRNRLPSMLKRIGIASLFVIVLKFTHVCWLVAGLYIETQQSSDWFHNSSYIVTMLIFQSIISTVYEFVCAQSPCSKRGILIGYTSAIIFISSIIGNAVIRVLIHNFFKYTIHPIITVSVTSAFSIIGFVLHCIASHKYKMRVREDIDNPHVWVENVYNKYFDQQDAYIRNLTSTSTYSS